MNNIIKIASAAAAAIALTTGLYAQTAGYTQKGKADMSAAFDNNANTRWSNEEHIKKGMYIAFDLGEAKEISSISFNLGTSPNDFPAKFEVFTGPSFADLSKQEFKASKAGGTLNIFLDKPVEANVIKIVADADADWWWSIHELSFNKAKISPLASTETYTQKGKTDISAAYDGDTNTRWSSGEGIRNGMFVAFQFPEAKEFSKIIVNIEGSPNDFPTKFDVLTGDTLADATDKAVIEATRRGNIITIAIESPTAAKVYKIQSTADKPDWWWSIHEISFE